MPDHEPLKKCSWCKKGRCIDCVKLGRFVPTKPNPDPNRPSDWMACECGHEGVEV